MKSNNDKSEKKLYKEALREKKKKRRELRKRDPADKKSKRFKEKLLWTLEDALTYIIVMGILTIPIWMPGVIRGIFQMAYKFITKQSHEFMLVATISAAILCILSIVQLLYQYKTSMAFGDEELSISWMLKPVQITSVIVSALVYIVAPLWLYW